MSRSTLSSLQVSVMAARYAAVFPLSEIINWIFHARGQRAEELPHSYQMMCVLQRISLFACAPVADPSDRAPPGCSGLVSEELSESRSLSGSRARTRTLSGRRC